MINRIKKQLEKSLGIWVDNYKQAHSYQQVINKQAYFMEEYELQLNRLNAKLNDINELCLRRAQLSPDSGVAEFATEISLIVGREETNLDLNLGDLL